MQLVDWVSIAQTSLESLVFGAIDFVPRLIFALVWLIVGWFIAVGIGRLIADILKKIRFNQIFERGNWEQALERANIDVDPAGFVGSVIKWVLVIVFLSGTLEILGMSQFTELLNERVLTFLPNIVVAAFVFVAAVILADILEKILRVTVEGAQAGHGHVVGAIVRWSVWVFAFVIILDQLSIAGALPTTIFQGLVGMLALAGGLAFGLGGKDMAAEILKNLKSKM